MTKIPTPFLVAVVGKRAFLKIPERANCMSSVELNRIVTALRSRGNTIFVLDLSGCLTMDSTFLGVLTGFVLPLEGDMRSPQLDVRLLNANRRIVELLESLCVEHLFTFELESEPCTRVFEPWLDHPLEPSKRELSSISLKAHLHLMELDPANIPKFKDVAKFLSEDLIQVKQPEPSTKIDL